MKRESSIMSCVCAIIVFLLGVVCGWLVWHHRNPEGADVEVMSSTVSIMHDTVRDTVRDTVTVARPVMVAERRPTSRSSAADASVAVDSTSLPRPADSVTGVPPYVQREYADSSYRAWVSGYGAQLDSVQVYPRTVTVTERVVEQITIHPDSGRGRKRRWHLGPTVSYGYTPGGWQVSVGIGLTWDLLSF